jgi:hypothetical protein
LPTVDCEALGKLTEKLRDDEFRERFCSDPEETIQRDELSEGLPSEFVDALGQLTPEELKHIGEIIQLLEGYDLLMKQPSNCWF